MMTRKSDFTQRAIARVKQLWHLYILGENPQLLKEEIEACAENLLMIGTGRHELYPTKEACLLGMSEDQIESSEIQFELPDEWYSVQSISETVCVVYGSIWAREKRQPGQTIFVDMQDSRFTVVCRDTDEGVQICSIHHSMPYIDQGEGEYYPKTLSSLAKELELKSELDRMTELYTRYHMEQQVTRAMSQTDGYFLMVDLDGFKVINDTMGHLIGDQVIRAFAKLLKNFASDNALLGRMGGDEFAIWDFEIQSMNEVQLRFNELLSACGQLSSKLGIPVTCSAGIVHSRRGQDDFVSLYQRADQALYHAKAHGKARIFLGE